MLERAVRLRAVGILGITLTLMVSLVSPSPANIYWGDWTTQRIGESQLDGILINSNFLTASSNIQQVTVYGDHIYWSNYDANSVSRARLDGTELVSSFLVASQPSGVSVNADFIYWTDSGLGTIGRAHADGSEPEPNFITGVSSPQATAIDHTYIYWSNGATSSIGRARLDGSEVDPNFIPVQSPAQKIAVTADYLYWTGFGINAIGRALVSGDDVDEAFLPAAAPAGIAVDAEYVYWSNFFNGEVARAPLSGGEAPVVLLTTGGFVGGIAVRGAEPTVSSVSPAIVEVGHQADIAVTGTGFSSLARVTVGGQPCDLLGAPSPSQAFCSVPPHSDSGSVDVVIENPDGQRAIAVDALTYVQPQPAPVIKKQDQTPAKKCVREVPKILRVGKSVRLTKPKCRTNAGKKVRVSIKTVTVRGDQRRVVRRGSWKKGFLLRVWEPKLRVKVKYAAPATSTFRKYKAKRVFVSTKA